MDPEDTNVNIKTNSGRMVEKKTTFNRITGKKNRRIQC